jgi:hypothetical protein
MGEEMISYFRSSLGLVFLICLIVTVVQPRLAAAEIKVNVDAEALIVSQYIWRGMVLNEDLSLQPTLTVTYNDFLAGALSFNVWGQMDLTDFGKDKCHYTDDCKSREWQFTEVDFTLDYSYSFDKYTIGVGMIWYLFPNWDHSEDTHEVYLALSYDCLLQPALTIYYDFDEVDGFYLNLAVGHSFPVNDKFSIDLSSSVGYGDSDTNDANFGNDTSALVDFNLGLNTPYQVTEHITITPTLMWSSVIDSDNRDGVKSNEYCDDPDNIYGGISIGFSF